MKITTCDRCGVGVDHPNKIHVYNYTVRKKYGRKYNKPKRDDFDLCDDCRKFLIKWFSFKNPGGKE